MTTFKNSERRGGIPDDPDDHEDPWCGATNPWLFKVYSRMVERRENRE